MKSKTRSIDPVGNTLGDPNKNMPNRRPSYNNIIISSYNSVPQT